MIDLAQADRTMRTNGEPFDRFASLSRLERQNAALLDALVLLLNVEGAAKHGARLPGFVGLDVSYHFDAARAAIAAAEGQA